MIAESGASEEDCEDIVYSTPDKLLKSPRRAGVKSHIVRHDKPGVLRRKAPKPGIVEELGKYDMHGRPKPVKKKGQQKYDHAGHVIRTDAKNGRRNKPINQLESANDRRKQGAHERQHPVNRHDARKKERFGGAGGGGIGYASPHRSVSVPVIRIKKVSESDRIPAATGNKKNAKSPFLGEAISARVLILYDYVRGYICIHIYYPYHCV
jgi:hypothetical protein